MGTALALSRARSDIEVISRAGLPLFEFMDEAADALNAAVPSVAGCVSTVDPATTMVSSTRKLGALGGRNDSDVEWAQIEYGGDDPTGFAAMRAAGQVVVGVRDATDGAIDRSPRMRDLLVPRFGFHDEARVLFGDRRGVWGTLSIFSGTDDPSFAPDQLHFLAGLAPAFTRGIRTGLLAQLRRTAPMIETGPAVIVVDAQNRIVQSSPGAQEHLRRMAAVPRMGDPLHYVQALVSGARRFVSGEVDRMPRSRVRTRDGVWLVLHAAPLGGAADRAGDVVVTVEEARPHDVLDLVAAAFGLTARECQVMAHVLRGSGTKEMATALFVSPYTVQDHLKSIFEKAGVASRRELVARVYFDQYAPRSGTAVGSRGWYVDGG